MAGTDTVKRSRRSMAWRFVLLAVSICLALAVSEGFLRLTGYCCQYVNARNSFHVYDATVGYGGKPDFEGRFRTVDFDVRVAHNGDGFRRQEHRHAAAGHGQRIYVFGDSFTWGWGVEQGEVYTDQMSRSLKEYEVQNFGLDGSGTIQQHALFERHVKQQLRPGEMVLLGFFSNDFSDNIRGCLRGSMRDGKIVVTGPGPPHSKLKSWLKDHFYVFNLVAYQVDHLQAVRHQWHGARRAAELQKLDGGPKDRDIPLDSREAVVTSHFLEQFRDDCHERGATFVIAAIAEDPVLLDIANRLEIEVIELVPHFQAAVADGRLRQHTFQHDLHWTAESHAIAGKVLANYILQLDSAAEVAERVSPSEVVR